VVLVGSGHLGKYIFRYSDALPAAAFVLKLKCQASGVSTPHCNNDNSMKWLVLGGLGWGKGKILSEGAGRPADRQPTKAVKEGADQSPLAGRPNCFLLYKNRVNSSGNINSKSNSITKGSRWRHRDAPDS